jgi:riboflavin synthase
MFTGIVQEVGNVLSLQGAQDLRVEISYGRIDPGRLGIGDSICVDGVCLTVAERNDKSFFADVSVETLSATTLGSKRTGARVNLEAALRAGDSLGGHWVSGHVDGVAEVLDLAEDARSLRVELAAPRQFARYIARKGSVTLDGVSLTVNAVVREKFSVNLIPHTLGATTLGALSKNSRVNLEVDVLARYVERLSDLEAGEKGA